MADALAQQHVFAHGEIHLDINFGLYATSDSKVENIKGILYRTSHQSNKPIHSKTSIFLRLC